MRTLVVLLLGLSVCFAQGTQEISKQEAATHIEKHADVVAPPLAKAANIGGTVSIQIEIEQDGSMKVLRVISGHPLLIGTALEAVKRWHYTPFLADGKQTTVRTTVDVAFPGGRSESEEATNEAYFAAVDKCREALKNAEFEKAESFAMRAIDLSEKLPDQRIAEREGAQSLAGNALYFQKRYADAKPYYERAVKLREQIAGAAKDADMATCYQNLARDVAMLGDLQRADSLFEKADQTYAAALIALPEMKSNYSVRQTRCLKDHASVKMALHDEGSAKALNDRANSEQ